MSQPNRNRRWIFERELYGQDCTLLRQSVAAVINRPSIVQYELFPSVGDLVATEISRLDDLGK